MKKIKVATILGTRPEIIRLAECIKLNDQYFEHVLIHTGQNYDYELNEIFFEELGLRKPDFFLSVSGNHLGETIGNVISKSYEILASEKPDALLVLGDTNSVLSTIAAKRLKIPIFHMEAGNRCFDQNVPEEINRKVTDSITNHFFTTTPEAGENLKNTGVEVNRIHWVGNTMIDTLIKHRSRFQKPPVWDELNLTKKGYLVMTLHRPANVDEEEKLKS